MSDVRVPAMIVMRPGDQVLVTLVEDPDEDVAQAMAHTLHQSFPGVEFVLMGGVAGVALLAGKPPMKPVRRVG